MGNGKEIKKWEWENNGKEIKWSQLIELMEKSSVNSGLYIGRKLTREHVVLTSYSRMTVLLAAQVSDFVSGNVLIFPCRY